MRTKGRSTFQTGGPRLVWASIWSGAWSVRARGATRGPLDVLNVRSSTEIRALLRDQKKRAREDAARLPNTTALLSHTKRWTRRARTAVVTEEPQLSAAHAGYRAQRSTN